MADDVFMLAAEALQRIETDFAITARRVVKGTCGTCFVTWKGTELEINKYAMEKLVALDAWHKEWGDRLGKADITPRLIQDADYVGQIILHREPVPEPDDGH